jgi:hypothetical protein
VRACRAKKFSTGCGSIYNRQNICMIGSKNRGSMM